MTEKNIITTKQIFPLRWEPGEFGFMRDPFRYVKVEKPENTFALNSN